MRADIQPVGSTDGVLTVPDDPAQVGWWAGSVLVGSGRGSVVLDGHIDSATRGVGALWKLDELSTGNTVQVRTVSGRLVTYQVRARRVYRKTGGLPATMFSRTGPEQLVLISCGGPFDDTTRSYLDNVVVYATPKS